MAERFYLNCELKPGEIAVVEGGEAHHIAHVARLQTGDALTLFNGNGCEYPAFIQTTAKRRVCVQVAEERQADRELPFPLTIASALPKGDRGGVLIEKLTELGVTRFTPLRTERSVVDPGQGKLEKLRRQVIEACKQCGRNVLMAIEETVAWSDFVATDYGADVRLIAHPRGQHLESQTARSQTAKHIAVAIGPEGGWTDAEVQSAEDAGWTPVACGPRIMRIETAAIYFAAVLASHQI